MAGNPVVDAVTGNPELLPAAACPRDTSLGDPPWCQFHSKRAVTIEDGGGPHSPWQRCRTRSTGHGAPASGLADAAEVGNPRKLRDVVITATSLILPIAHRWNEDLM